MVNKEGEEWLNEQMPGIYNEVGEVIKEIFARMAWGQEFTLSNGRVGKIQKLYQPKKDDNGWRFGFDITFASGSPDHLEFCVSHTGGGGMVEVPTVPIPYHGNS